MITRVQSRGSAALFAALLAGAAVGAPPAGEPAATGQPAPPARLEPAGPPRPDWRGGRTDGHPGCDRRRPSWSRVSTSWLGVRIERPTEELRAQLPALARGTGFVIETIERDGPAQAAGLQSHDVLWRLDDQLLINEAQLAVLLGLHQPGDVVRLDFYRGGKPMQSEVKLGEPPAGPGFQMAEDNTPFVVGGADPALPLHIVNVPRRSATVEHPDGRAEVTVDESGFRLTISDPEGRTIHEGPLFDAQRRLLVPEAWRERVESLHSTLMESLRRAQGAPNNRPPRLRVIPPQSGP